MRNKTNYVVGFMFDATRHRVVLIRKNKPAWQSGKLNGVGGKIEDGETANEAMAREFREETGCETSSNQWELFATMGDDENWNVDCFLTIGELALCTSMTLETIEVIEVREINTLRGDMVENLCWLIPLAMDVLADGRPAMVSISYPKE